MHVRVWRIWWLLVCYWLAQNLLRPNRFLQYPHWTLYTVDCTHVLELPGRNIFSFLLPGMNMLFTYHMSLAQKAAITISACFVNTFVKASLFHCCPASSLNILNMKFKYIGSSICMHMQVWILFLWSIILLSCTFNCIYHLPKFTKGSSKSDGSD